MADTVAGVPPPPRRLFRVYVDESGDRGATSSASPLFVLSALIVRDDRAATVRTLRDQVCLDLGKPTSATLHWSQNIKAHSDRRHVASLLGGCGAGVFTFVIVDKNSLRGRSMALSDPAAMYNYAVRRLLERVSWYVHRQHGEAIVTFAHVKRFPYARLTSYLAQLRQGSTQIRWEALRGDPRITDPTTAHLLQVADLAAGCLASALIPDRFGAVEDAYLLAIWERIHCRPPGDIRSYGLNVVGDPAVLESFPWWSKVPRA